MYHFIPVEYEKLVSENLAIWNKQSETAFVVITPVLKTKTDFFENIKDQKENDLIKKIEMYCIGFLIEGVFSLEIQEICNKLEGYKSFLNDTDFHEFYNSI